MKQTVSLYVSSCKDSLCPRPHFIHIEFGIDRRFVIICTDIEEDNGVDPIVHTE